VTQEGFHPRIASPCTVVEGIFSIL